MADEEGLREVVEMVKLYRGCLQKNEENPVKARENCAIYKEAIRDLDHDNVRTVIDKLRDKKLNPTMRHDPAD